MADDTSPAPIAVRLLAHPPIAHVAGPARWSVLKRPAPVPPRDHDPMAIMRIHFDVQFAAAASLGKWEDEWPSLTESQFDTAMTHASRIELGGHNPDGTHPRAGKE